MLKQWLLCGLLIACGSVLQEVCDDDASGLLQLPRGPPTATHPSAASSQHQHGVLLTKLNASGAASLGLRSLTNGSATRETAALPVGPAGHLPFNFPAPAGPNLQPWDLSLTSLLAQPQLTFCAATAICSLVLLSELAPVLSFEGGRFFSCLLAAACLVGANLVAQESLRSDVGVLDLIYARFVVLAFVGVALVRLHPERPLALPTNPQQAIQILLGAFALSAGAMLLCGSLCFAPGTFALLSLALLPSFGSFLKQRVLKEKIEWDESFSSVGLLLSILPLLCSAAHRGKWMLLGTFLGLLASMAMATASLVQRNLCTMHHTVILTWSGGIGLIMFSPVAVIFPEQARVLWSLDSPRLASLGLFGALNLATAALMLRVATGSLGMQSEATYMLVAGLAAGLQYAADVALLSEPFALLVQTSLVLIATFLTFSYMVSCRQIIRMEECVSLADSGGLHFEPQRFGLRPTRGAAPSAPSS